MRVTELGDRLTHWGVPWGWVAGAERRGLEFPTRPDGALRHWIGSSGRGLGVITNGRPDLTGPLAQLNQTRDVDQRTGLDFVWLVATGKANHAGAGVLNGIVGNYKLLGLEIDWAGSGEFFGPMRELTSELCMRAMLDCCAGTDTNDVGEHREYARPLGRKQDTNLSGDKLRQRMRTITPFRPDEEEFDVDTKQKVDALYELFANGNPSFGAGTPPRWQVVLDNAIWNRDRITTAYQGVIDTHEVAEAAKKSADEAKDLIRQLAEKLGVELPTG